MPYDVKNMSDYALEQMSLVMENLHHKKELNPSSVYFVLGPIKGIDDNENRQILWGLEAEGCLGSMYESSYLKEPFYPLLNEINLELLRRHNEQHHRKDKSLNDKPHYDEINGALYIQGQKIQIIKHDEDTKQNQLLRHIFITNAKDIGREFDFTEFPFDDVGDKKKFKEICRTACSAINKKIAKETENKITDFLEFNTRTYGWLKINPKYLPK